jgi:hypothetical protein
MRVDDAGALDAAEAATADMLLAVLSPLPLDDRRQVLALVAARFKLASKRQRRPRKPSLASVAKQASKAGVGVARYEIKPDGTVVVVTGAPESSTESNPWLDDLNKVTKQ